MELVAERICNLVCGAGISPRRRTIDRKARKGRKGAAGAVGDGPPATGRRLTQAVRVRERMRGEIKRAFVPGPEPACARRVATPVADRSRGSLRLLSRAPLL